MSSHPLDPSDSHVRTDDGIRLLAAVLGDDARPVELLAARCSSPDGAQWCTRVLQELNPRPASCQAWREVKDSAKGRMKVHSKVGSDDASAADHLRYCIAIAGALAQFGESISATQPANVQHMINLIGPLLPEPWNGMFKAASVRMKALASG